MSEFLPAKRRVKVSVGDSVRIARELQELSQNQLAKLTGIPQPTVSATENGRVRLGVERAKVLARALKCPPAVLFFPGWESDSSQRPNYALERSVRDCGWRAAGVPEEFAPAARRPCVARPAHRER